MQPYLTLILTAAGWLLETAYPDCTPTERTLTPEQAAPLFIRDDVTFICEVPAQ